MSLCFYKRPKKKQKHGNRVLSVGFAVSASPGSARPEQGGPASLLQKLRSASNCRYIFKLCGHLCFSPFILNFHYQEYPKVLEESKRCYFWGLGKLKKVSKK